MADSTCDISYQPLKNESMGSLSIPQDFQDETPGFFQSQSLPQRQSLRDQYHDLRVRYETLEQQAKILELEKEEFSREISKLHKENEELKTKYDTLNQQHTDIFDNKKSLATVLSSKSVALDDSQSTIEQLQSHLKQLQRKLKKICAENEDLITENDQYKQRLEELNTTIMQKDETYGKEKENYQKQISLLNQNIDQLQHQLHIQTTTEEFKYNEPTTPTHSDNGTPRMERPRLEHSKTIRLKVEEFSRKEADEGSVSQSDFEPDQFDRQLTPTFNKMPSRPLLFNKTSISINRNDGYGMGLFGFGVDPNKPITPNTGHYSHNTYHSQSGFDALGMPELQPLLDSPQVSIDGTQIGGGGSNHYVTPSAASNSDGAASFFHPEQDTETSAAMREEYETKMSELISQHKLEKQGLLEKYIDTLDRLDKVEGDYKEQGKKLHRKLKTIKELRSKNAELAKKISGKRACYVVDWFG